jgi:DNA-binding FadR family transcriptional regulator
MAGPAVPLDRVHVPKAAELVAASLRRQIVRGQLKEGDALPHESVLMATFAVSRPTLREAFRVLESEGLIRVRRGAHGGARVHVPDSDVAARFTGLVLQHRGATVADVLEARALIEPPAAAILARRGDPADIATLTANLEHTAESLRVPTDHVVEHTDFHELMAELAGNHTLAMLTRMLHHLVNTAWQEHRVGLPGDQRLAEDESTVRAHRKFLAYIESGDADRAEAFWRKHIRDSNAVLLDTLGPTKLLDLGT